MGTSSTFRPNIQRSWQSPTTSAFWAASIPRKESGGAQSSASGSSHNDSPFIPSQASSRHNTFPTLYNNASTQMDPTQVQSPFWTPFPGQTMPMPPQHVVPSMGFSAVEATTGQWHGYGSGIGGPPHVGHPSSIHSSQEAMDENATFQDWHWQ